MRLVLPLLRNKDVQLVAELVRVRADVAAVVTAVSAVFLWGRRAGRLGGSFSVAATTATADDGLRQGACAWLC